MQKACAQTEYLHSTEHRFGPFQYSCLCCSVFQRCCDSYAGCIVRSTFSERCAAGAGLPTEPSFDGVCARSGATTAHACSGHVCGARGENHTHRHLDAQHRECDTFIRQRNHARTSVDQSVETKLKRAGSAVVCHSLFSFNWNWVNLQGRIVACDKNAKKISRIKENASTWNLETIEAYATDSTKLCSKDSGKCNHTFWQPVGTYLRWGPVDFESCPELKCQI